MARLNPVAVFCVFLVCLLISVKISSSQTIIRGAVLHGLVVNQFVDPCAGKSIGQACTGGAIYAGTGYSSGGLNPVLRYMVTPGGCTTETCSGAGGTDSVTKAWANGSGTTANNVITGATDVNNGKSNTAILVTLPPHYTDTDAAHWCTGMNYGGYTDWYLPSLNELNYVLFPNDGVLPGIRTFNFYWSSTEDGSGGAWAVDFFNGSSFFTGKTITEYVRCARTY